MFFFIYKYFGKLKNLSTHVFCIKDKIRPFRLKLNSKLYINKKIKCINIYLHLLFILYNNI